MARSATRMLLSSDFTFRVGRRVRQGIGAGVGSRASWTEHPMRTVVRTVLLQISRKRYRYLRLSVRGLDVLDAPD